MIIISHIVKVSSHRSSICRVAVDASSAGKQMVNGGLDQLNLNQAAKNTRCQLGIKMSSKLNIDSWLMVNISPSSERGNLNVSHKFIE